MEQYGSFAQVYDRLMADIDYEGWCGYIEELFASKNAEVKNILELACGTGNLTIPFTKKNYDIAGVDISFEMLEQAKLKAEKENVELVLLNQDMVELDFELYDLDSVVCGCDGFNYITEDEDIQSVFDKVYELLKDGGVFVFDISSQYKLENILGYNTFGDNSEDVSYIWNNYYDDEQKLCEMELSFFMRNDSGLYERFDEDHIQRAYSEDEITGFLENAGFSDIDVYADFTFEKPKADSERLFFVCRK